LARLAFRSKTGFLAADDGVPPPIRDLLVILRSGLLAGVLTVGTGVFSAADRGAVAFGVEFAFFFVRAFRSVLGLSTFFFSFVPDGTCKEQINQAMNEFKIS
jgi:hypothetical protein